MSESGTKSLRKPLRFWGWGYADEDLHPEEHTLIDKVTKMFVPEGLVEIEPPKVEDFDLPASRLPAIPEHLSDIISTTPYDRLVHSYGKSYADMARMLMREVPNAPDAVAFPGTEDDIQQLFRYASENNIALIPFGGGTSVCGGVEPDVGDTYRATISVDMESLNQILEIDPVSRRARIQAGIKGPDLERQLKQHGLTLRHYPQSFPFVSLGGMLATRAGGHFATVYTHIEDMVEATRLVTPKGIIETRALPGSGAGPSADRMICGSEGTLGIITEATMRLQHRPKWRATASVRFDRFMTGVDAVRQIAQSGLFPSNCRLLDEAEVVINRIADKPCAILVLGFESSDHPQDQKIERAVAIAEEHGGVLQKDGISYNPDHAEKGSSEAESWRNAFIRMPYWRNRLTAMGMIADTFETVITWDKFPSLYKAVKSTMESALREITQRPFSFSCRFTHVYPDGPAPYFTFYCVGDTTGDLGKALEKWKQLKRISMEVLAEQGATVTHHHAVGRDHRFGYEQQTSPLFRQTLAAGKHFLDPQGILNPGALIDPQDKDVGIRGVLSDQGNPVSPDAHR